MTWLDDTQKKIRELHETGYYNDWRRISINEIEFHLHPDTLIDDVWMQKRAAAYRANANLLGVQAPPVNFYVYPSREFGAALGLVPAISFVAAREVHGHPKQSPGHELTHILLGELNTTKNIPANGLYAEGVCVYFDGTATNRRKHAMTSAYAEGVLDTDWNKWLTYVPGQYYPIVGSIIQYADERYGTRALIEFLKSLRDGSTNGDILIQSLFDISLDDFKKDWRDWLDAYTEK